MSSPIALKLFEFVDDFAREVTAGEVKSEQVVAGPDGVIVFCESFFDQLFANVLERPIIGFTATSKRSASRLAEEIKADPPASPELRSLVALFEKFCDMHGELIAGSYGAGEIEYRQFYGKYLQRLLVRAGAWASGTQHHDLAARIDGACTTSEAAVRVAAW